MRTGDPCSCGGSMRRRSTKTRGNLRTRYLKCDCCGLTAKEITQVDALNRDIRTDTNVVQCPNCSVTIVHNCPGESHDHRIL